MTIRKGTGRTEPPITTNNYYGHAILISLATVFLLGNPLFAAGMPVIPGGHGFGMDTPAGRAGEVIRVTNLDARGVGTLRECAEATEPRICVFDVSGVINIVDKIRITSPYITIAGQTAPSPGVMVLGAGITIKTHDVLIQHIRVRAGDRPDGPTPRDRDSLTLSRNARNIVIDHCSFSWALDENVSLYAYDDSAIHDVTMVDSIVSEGLYDSIHVDEGSHDAQPHSMGVLIAGELGTNSSVARVSLIRNLFAHNDARNPLTKDMANVVQDQRPTPTTVHAIARHIQRMG